MVLCSRDEAHFDAIINFLDAISRFILVLDRPMEGGVPKNDAEKPIGFSHPSFGMVLKTSVGLENGDVLDLFFSDIHPPRKKCRFKEGIPSTKTI